MKILIETKSFLKSLRLAAMVAPQRDMRPALQHVKIVTEMPRGAVLHATDTETGINVPVECGVFTQGAALLPVKRLVKTLELCKDESVILESTKTGIVLTANGKRSEFTLSYSVDEFPDVADFTGKSYCAIPSIGLQKM